MQDLDGKVAVITGGASGIGLAMAKRFGAAGMKLVLADIERGALEAAAKQMREAGREVLPVPTDVGDAEAMDALGEAVRSEWGDVHVLCNNAGVGAGGPMWTLRVEDWEFALRVNLWGVIHGIRIFVPGMVERNEGHVVNTASLAGLVSVPGMGPYNATKHAVVTISETLHGELRQAAPGVGVSVLCPGFVNTRIFESERNRPDSLRAAVAADPTESPERGELVAQFFANAMPPENVADQVHDAVTGGRFYILTHPGSEEAVGRRMRDVVEGHAPRQMEASVFASIRG